MTVFIILLLIVLNGLFVAAEFALLGAPRAALEQMGVSGNMVARRVSQILKTPRLQDRYIATAQLGVTFASLGLGMYGEHAVAGWLHEWLAQYGWASWLVAHGAASILSVAVLTYLHIVLGEMVPKALSLQYAAKLCLIIAMPMYVIQLCLYPLVVGMNALGNFFLGLLGVDRNESKSHYHSAEELQYIIEESHENGALPQESGRIMDGLFDLDDLYVHQVMTPRVRIDAIPEGAEHEQIREIVRRTRRTRYPVDRGDLDRSSRPVLAGQPRGHGRAPPGLPGRVRRASELERRRAHPAAHVCRIPGAGDDPTRSLQVVDGRPDPLAAIARTGRTGRWPPATARSGATTAAATAAHRRSASPNRPPSRGRRRPRTR